MSFIRKVILYNLFIVSNMNAILHSEDEKAQDHENLLLVFDNSPEEIYPLEDTDTISLISEIQNYVDNLELDPTGMTNDCEQSTLKDSVQVPQIIIDTNSLPTAPDDIVILDHKNNNELSSELVSCLLDDDQKIVCDIHNIEQAIENIVQDAIDTIYEELELDIVETKREEHNDQKLINNEELIIIAPTEQTCELCPHELKPCFIEQIDLTRTNSSDNCPCCITIEIDNFENERTTDNGILIFQDLSNYNQKTETHELKSEVTNDEINLDDEIVPVPHDLINSVKKATNKKKKLEKKEKSKKHKKKKNKKNDSN